MPRHSNAAGGREFLANTVVMSTFDNKVVNALALAFSTPTYERY